jgi:hypothetical protein
METNDKESSAHTHWDRYRPKQREPKHSSHGKRDRETQEAEAKLVQRIPSIIRALPYS